MSSSELCPDPDVFVEFLTGKLKEDQLKEIEHHLARCSACGDTVRSMHVEDTFVDLVHSKEKNEPTESDTELQVLMAQLESLAAPQAVEHSHRAPSEDLQARVHEVESLLAPTGTDDRIGQLAHYRILQPLGAGGMGVVYQAEDTHLQRLVALKILRPSLGGAARERFIQEARAAAAIDHDHVVTIYNVGKEGPLAFLAMQWLDGETLESRIGRDVRLSPDEVIQIGSQIADGLAAAHAKKLIHRDIKPANIWLEAGRNRAKILDFGLAQVVDDNPQLTETGMIAGTPAYMSPEQAQGRAVDERSDLFSLGTLLYRMLTGNLPFEATNALATIRSIQQDIPPAPRQVDMSIPASLSDLVMDLLEKDPRSRPENAETVAESLRQRTRPVRPSAANSLSGPLASSTRGNWSWHILVSLLLACGGIFAATMIYRIATDYGEIVVKTNEPDVQVEVLQGGDVVEIIDIRTMDRVTVRSGTYHLKLKGANSEVTLDPRQVTLRRNEKEIVNVSRTENARRTPDGITEGPDVLSPPTAEQLAQQRHKVMGVMADATARIARGDYRGAQRLLLEAQALHVPDQAFQPNDKRPWMLLMELARLNDPTRQVTPGTISAGSQLKIQATGVSPDSPIDGNYTIEPSGSVALGAAYGRVLVAGMTYEQAEHAIMAELAKMYAEPKVQVTVPDNTARQNTANARVESVTRIALKYIPSDEAKIRFLELYPQSNLQVASDTRTNCLLVTAGSEQERRQLLNLVDKIDVRGAVELDPNRGDETALYDGKPYDYWLNVVSSERSPNLLARALAALAALTDEGNSDSTCSAVFSATPANSAIARDVLFRCDPETVTKHVVRELSEGNDRSLGMIYHLWSNVLTSSSSHRALRASFSQHSHVICSHLLELTKDDSTRHLAQHMLLKFCSTTKIESETASAVTPLLKELLKQPQDNLDLDAAETLARVAPNSDGLTEMLIETIQDESKGTIFGETTRSERAIRVLAQLGPRARTAIPTLLDLLPHWVTVPDPDQKPPNGGTKISGFPRGAVAILETFGEIGPAAESALPVLKRFVADDVDDQGSGTTKAAREAISKIQAVPGAEAGDDSEVEVD